jgi:hypothetical protein
MSLREIINHCVSTVSRSALANFFPVTRAKFTARRICVNCTRTESSLLFHFVSVEIHCKPSNSFWIFLMTTFTYRTSCLSLDAWLRLCGGRHSGERWVDVFVSPYVNCEVVQGRITNMAGRKLVRYLHDKALWSNLRTSSGARVAPLSTVQHCSDKTAHTESTVQHCSDQTPHTDQTDQKDHTDQTDQTDQTGHTNRTDKPLLFPVIVKPRRGTNGKNKYPICHHEQTLQRALVSALNRRADATVVQQYICSTQLEPTAPGADLRVFGVLWKNRTAFLCGNAVIKWYNADCTNNGKHVTLDRVRVDRRLLQDKFDALAAQCADLFGHARALGQWFSADVVVLDQGAEPFVIDVNPMSALGTVMTSTWAAAEQAVWCEVIAQLPLL